MFSIPREISLANLKFLSTNSISASSISDLSVMTNPTSGIRNSVNICQSPDPNDVNRKDVSAFDEYSKFNMKNETIFF